MNKGVHVLIVEDSENDALLLVRELRRGGFEPDFERVDTAEAMATALAKQKWDLVIADYTMPHFSGIAALELLKGSNIDIPFIIVSGSIGEDIAVAAMKAGAHDYLMKGNVQRLVPSIERELREAEIRHQRRQAEVKVKHNVERLQALHEIDLAITSTLDLRGVLDVLLDKINLVLTYWATTVRLLNNETGELEPVACRNVNEQNWKRIKQKKLQGLPKLVLENKIPITVSNVQTDPRSAASDFARSEGLISYIGVPLIAKGQTLGLIAFYTKELHSFTDEEIDFLTTLAGQAAVAIYNSRLFERIKKQMIELEKSNEVKDEFLSIISHELRTPLNLIMGYTGLVRDGSYGELKSEQDAALGKVTTQSKYLLEMVDEILRVTRIETGKSDVYREKFDLVSFFNDLKSSYECPLDKALNFKWDYPLQVTKVCSDSDKLRHILQNLINNAIKFTEDDGSVTVSVGVAHDTNTLVCQVADTGIGIPNERIPGIFEKFRQVDSSVTRKYGGLGLGLHIVRTYTELLNGTVEVKSKLGVGSVFTVRIPVEAVQSDAILASPDVIVI